MLFETFPNRICEEYYWVILYLLYEYMSDENLALVMSYFINKPLEIIVNVFMESAKWNLILN